MKTFLTCSALCMLSAHLVAENGHPHVVDTLKMRDLQGVQVVSTRADHKTPVAFTVLDKATISEFNKGKDIPSIMNYMLGVTTSSDAGTGIGYTSLRIRGTDPTRINITANGIPMNDAESSQLYWVNIGDFASSIENMQVQRGVGTSTNGAGAFGATINMQTENISFKPFASIDLAGGSYDTYRATAKWGTGLLHNHWAFQARGSLIKSDGYVDRASARLDSYFLQGGYFSDQTVIKLIAFSGKEKTYHAWYYVTKEQMREKGRRYNPAGEYQYMLDGKPVTAWYSNQTDNYHQQNYQLLWNQRLNSNLHLNTAIHYTKGHGYYEQYKSAQKLYKYLLHSDNGKKSDLVRRKCMDNDFCGLVASLNYDSRQDLKVNLGGAFNRYQGSHFGKVIWVNDFKNQQQSLQPDHPYYDNMAYKSDANIYLRANQQVTEHLNVYGDVQYRYVDYKMKGTSQEFIDEKQRMMDLKRKYDFFNPKAGLIYQIDDKHTLYASYAMAHKEPTRNDFEQMMAAAEEVAPQSETLHDWEAGYNYKSDKWRAGINLYHMHYDNQFVLTGAQDANGEMVARNIKNSYRMGVELLAGAEVIKNLNWDFNATWSRNRAVNMRLLVADKDGKTVSTNVGNTPLAYSPDLILHNILSYKYADFGVRLMTCYVSKQYMTNSGFDRYLNSDGKGFTEAYIAPYCVSDLDLRYKLRLKGGNSAEIGCTIYNIFNTKYESNGSASMNFKNENGKVIAYDGGWAWSTYSVQAPIHALAYVSFNF